MFEHHREPVLDTKRFTRRLVKYLMYALLLIGVSLAIGVGGYMHFAQLPFVDAFLNASMILGGMGPVDALPNAAAKYFASFYALYCGITLLGAVAVFLAPVMHRMLHVLHLDDGRRGS